MYRIEDSMFKVGKSMFTVGESMYSGREYDGREYV